MIDLGRWQEIKDLVQATLDESPEERDEYLDSACEGDRELRAAVEALLQVSETSAHLYDDLQFIPEPVRELTLSAGDSVGPYTVVRSLGRGGMSSVYLADDTEHERHIALKVLPPRLFRLSPREHKLLARLNHPNIATLFSSGTTSSGFRYLALEYVEGSRLTDYCTERGLTLEERLKLFAKVCDAVSYAHAKTIVHRDLTPNNILVTDSGEPKLLDFGIAKELPTSGEAATLTEASQRPLTLSFSSPEQLSGEETGTASDIYSLGVLLCVLMTGRLPYKVRSAHDLPWAIRNQDPERPSDLIRTTELEPLCGPPPGVTSRRLQGDLDAIAHRALRKEPDQRYSSVLELAADIRHHLLHEPVRARQGSRWYRVRKFVRRYRIPVFSAAASVLLLLSSIVVVSLQQRETARQRDSALRESARANQATNILLDALGPANPWTEQQDVTGREILNKVASQLEGDLSLDPMLVGQLRSSVGSLYAELGEFEEAELHLRDALALRRAVLGSDHLDVAETETSLGGILLLQSKYDEAEELLRHALSVRRQAASPELMVTLNNLATLLQRKGLLEESVQCSREAVALARKADPDARENLGRYLGNLSQTLRAQARLDEALTAASESLEIRKKVFGSDHPSTAQAENALAAIHADLGNYAKAEALYRKVLLVYRENLPPNHPAIPLLIGNLAGVKQLQGKYEEAEALHREALEVQTEIFGREHRAVAGSLNNIATLVARDPSRLSEAGDMLEEVLRILHKILAPTSPAIVIATANLAGVRCKQGRFAEAETSYQEAITAAESGLGLDHPETAFTKVRYSALLVEEERYEQAESTLREAISVLEERLPEGHPDIAVAHSTLGEALTGLDRFIEAEALLEASYHTLAERAGCCTVRTLDALKRLIALYQRWNQPEKAAEYQRLLLSTTPE